VKHLVFYLAFTLNSTKFYSKELRYEQEMEIQEMGNQNHPKKGSSISVQPIRNIKDIKRIKRKLKNQSTRDLLLFTLGINCGLRISDLLKLKVAGVRHLMIGETLEIREGKTGKRNVLMINGEVKKVLDRFIEEVSPLDEDFLFKSRQGKNKHIDKSYVNQMMKKWTKGMKGNYGTHTLRKTFGYIQRTHFGVGFEILCKRFGHSNPSITMRYLGIQDKEVNGILMNDI
jgi:integrase